MARLSSRDGRTVEAETGWSASKCLLAGTSDVSLPSEVLWLIKAFSGHVWYAVAEEDMTEKVRVAF